MIEPKKGPDNNLGFVIIGRNEGERLKQCLDSVLDYRETVVYVDSGSSDGSVELARELGIEVVRLDMSMAFTAARARNAGFDRLSQLSGSVEFVQFADGDCELVEGWVEAALNFLANNAQVAVVCGRRRERFPRASIYNMLCDIEWDTPVGEAKACGGDAMMRVEAFKGVNGFCGDLIAGEEPELCVRLRQNGWQVWRMNYEMTLHDAAITAFSQWWSRSVRTGYAFIQGAFIHGASPEKHWVKETLRTWFWTVGIILSVVVLVLMFGAWGLTGLLLYPLQVVRLGSKSNLDSKVKWSWAFFTVIGKFSEILGQLKFLKNVFLQKPARLIEYK